VQHAKAQPPNLDATLNYVRPAPYDSLRKDDYVDLDMRVGKAFKFKRRYTATLFAEVFNLINSNDFATYNGNILSSGFETPETENRNRTAQFGFRLDYQINHHTRRTFGLFIAYQTKRRRRNI